MIKTNKNGERNLRALRKEAEESEKISVHYHGGWIIGRWNESAGLWVHVPAPYWMDERQVLEYALGYR